MRYKLLGQYAHIRTGDLVIHSDGTETVVTDRDAFHHVYTIRHLYDWGGSNPYWTGSVYWGRYTHKTQTPETIVAVLRLPKSRKRPKPLVRL